MAELKMPQLSDTMEEGKVLRWCKTVGDEVTEGEIVVEVETDKADMEVEASASGVLSEVRVREGQTAPVGAVLAVIDAGAAGRAPGPSQPASQPSPTGEGADVAPAAASPSTAQPVTVATPVARTLADELGVELRRVRGTGPGGRVSRKDVQAAHARAELEGLEPLDEPAVPSAPDASTPLLTRTRPPVPAPASAEPPGGGPRSAATPSRLRAAIARRMIESARDVPAFHLSATVSMDAAVALRASLAESCGERAPTVNHIVIKAVADALRAHPRVNCRFVGPGIEALDSVNLGIAVAVSDGLVVPVIRDADRSSLLAIAARARDLVARAQAGSARSGEMTGASLTISNLGMYGVERFVGVITPPQAAILAVGAATESVVVRGGLPAVGWTLGLTLTCDHRSLDGAIAAPFLADVKRRLQQPALLLLSAEDLAR